MRIWTNGPLDTTISVLAAPPIRLWCWATEWSTGMLARLGVAVSVGAELVAALHGHKVSGIDIATAAGDVAGAAFVEMMIRQCETMNDDDGETVSMPPMVMAMVWLRMFVAVSLVFSMVRVVFVVAHLHRWSLIGGHTGVQYNVLVDVSDYSMLLATFAATTIRGRGRSAFSRLADWAFPPALQPVRVPNA